MLVNLSPQVPRPKEEKEMISVSYREGKAYVKINYSSLDIINTCLRKAYYTLERKLHPKQGAPALIFGTAIHHALEAWYLSPIESRKLPTKAVEKAQIYVHTGEYEEDQESGFFKALQALRKSLEPIMHTPEQDKRSPSNAAKIIAEYCKLYRDDGFTVLSDEQGPLVERLSRLVIYDSEDLQIELFGSIDVVLENKETGIVAVTDHKTTSALGKEFYNRIKPNHQYTGYILLAKEVLGLKASLFMINGLQVAKTKASFVRQFTERKEEDFQELKNTVEEAVRRYLKAKESGVWTQNAPQPCTMYGGCQYIRVCEVPQALKENLIQANWIE